MTDTSVVTFNRLFWIGLLFSLFDHLGFIVTAPIVIHTPAPFGSRSRLHAVEGDIVGVNLEALIASSSKKNSRDAAASLDRLRWPNAIIPYLIAPEYDDIQQEHILAAIRAFNETTCLRFVPYNDQTDHIFIAPGYGCTSFIGRVGDRQVVSLGPGFYHEQARIDRDNYVRINWNNILPDDRRQFSHYTSVSADEPYDFGSVMHYSEYSFSRSVQKGLWTIRPLDKYREKLVEDSVTGKIGQRVGLSAKDIGKINRMYQCPTRTVLTTTVTSLSLDQEMADTTTPGTEAGPTMENVISQPTEASQWTSGKPAAVEITEPSVDQQTFTTSSSETFFTENYKYTLKPGEKLEAGESIWNRNKNVKFSMESSGNAVLIRTCDMSVIWQTFTANRDDTPTSVALQSDGNLVVRNSQMRLLWSSETGDADFAGASLQVTNSGFLCLFKNGACLWQSGGLSQCRPAPSPTFKKAFVLLKSGASLPVGESVSSHGKTCNLTLEPEGDLVLRQNCDGAEIWAIRRGTGHSINLGDHDTDRIQEFIMSPEGNLIAHRPDGGDDFHITIPNAAGAELQIRNDCQICVFKDGSCRWTAHARQYNCRNVAS